MIEDGSERKHEITVNIILAEAVMTNCTRTAILEKLDGFFTLKCRYVRAQNELLNTQYCQI